MKQGRASVDVRAGTKTEPKAHAVSPAVPAQMGMSVQYKKTPMYEGRGLEAPKAASTVHKSGSQGRS
jgi:hypothetical protein